LKLRPRHPSSDNPFPSPIPCPACGYELPALRSSYAAASTSDGTGRTTWKSRLKTAWPARSLPSRMAALFRRN
jgi:hypothetical protein